MSDEQEQNDEAFAKRVARVLRPVEAFDDSFENDLVAAIRADRSVDARPLAPAWWRTARTFRLSPLVGLAMAASLAAIVSLATLGFAGVRPRASAPSAPPVAVVHDTVNVVRFVFVGQAKTVSLVGDFNAWGAQPVSLVPTGTSG